MNWLRNAAIAAVLTAIVYYGIGCYHEGQRVRDLDPPRVVVEKTHTTESYSCGTNCITNSDVFRLFAADGGTCRVDRHEWARVQKGERWKCMNLYGWAD